MITLIIAIIGAVTGIVALIIQFVEYKKSSVKLVIEIDEHISYYLKNTNETYKCEYIGVISAKISNCSSLPITIDEVIIVLDNYKVKHEPKMTKTTLEVKKGENTYTYLTINDKPKIPLRIECYDTVFVSFAFPFFDKFLNEKFELQLLTPRKTYKKKIELEEYITKFKKD